MINADRIPQSVKCPFCESENTELHSPFGTTLALVQYVCKECNSPFEWIKWEKEQRKNTDSLKNSSVNQIRE